MRSADHPNRPAQNRSTSWQLRARTLEFGSLPLLMGIVNVTPDSFSDGGRFFDIQAALAHSLKLIEEGADILDIGGESTRPYAASVSADEELRRVIPVLEQLANRITVPISIDTSKAIVAQEAVQAGAEIINDVSGLEGDKQMLSIAARSLVGVCAMHKQGTPQTMQNNPTYVDVVGDIYDYLQRRRDALIDGGVDATRICLDPGIGFGKTHEHNITLLAGCHRFHELGCPLLVGHSRKGFIGKVIGNQDADTTAGTIGVALSLARQGVQILRVHNVAVVRHALLLFQASGGFR